VEYGGSYVRSNFKAKPGNSGSAMSLLGERMAVAVLDSQCTGEIEPPPPFPPCQPCDVDGTGFGFDWLATSLHEVAYPLATAVVYVDDGHTWNGGPDGSVERPFVDVTSAVQGAQPGSVVSIVQGAYPDDRNLIIDTQMSLVTPLGPVVIGGS